MKELLAQNVEIKKLLSIKNIMDGIFAALAGTHGRHINLLKK